MLVKVASDLHLEKYHNSDHALSVIGLPKKCDLMILSGDICEAVRIADFLPYLSAIKERCTNVVYVKGNHENYRSESIAEASKALHYALQSIGIVLLDNECIDIGDTRIIGSTMWADLSGMGDEYLSLIQSFPDFRFVNVEKNKVQTIESLNHLHSIDKNFLKKEISTAIRTDFIENIIVATHFPLTWKVRDKKFSNQPFNHFFYNDFDSWFEVGGVLDSEKIKLITCGHTHASHSSCQNGMRLVCNPRGYYRRGEIECKTFSWNSVKVSIEI